MLTRPIRLMTWADAANSYTGYILKVLQNSVSSDQIEEEWSGNTATIDAFRNYPVHDGKTIYWLSGFRDFTNNGLVSYNGHSNKWEMCAGAQVSSAQIQMIQDRLVNVGSLYVYSGTPRKVENVFNMGSWGSPYDSAVLNGTVFVTDNADSILRWTYPFNTAPSIVTSTGMKISVLCPYKNEMYGLELAATSYLRKWNGASFDRVGSGQAIVDSADLNATPASACLFEHGGNLYVFFSYNTSVSSIWRHRCYQIDATTGAFTQMDSLVPASWKTQPTSTYHGIFEVHDDLGSSRQTFLISNEGRYGGWELNEFNPSDTPGYAIGSQRVYRGGIVWDVDTGNDVVDSLSDQSDVVDVTHRVSDIKANAAQNVTIRYKRVGNTSFTQPPADATEYPSGSEGKTSLSSKPSHTSLSDMDDDFSDESLDDDLWEAVTPFFYNSTEDFGYFSGATGALQMTLEEAGGRLIFGDGSTDACGISGLGIGVRSRWSVSGDFQADFTLKGLAGLTGNNTKYYRLCLMAKLQNNVGVGVFIYRNTGLTAYAYPFYLNQNGVLTAGTDSTNNPADDKVVRIARASGVWSTIINYGDAAQEDISASGLTLPVTYTGPAFVQAWAFAAYSAYWTAGDGPGISDFAIGGSGSLNRWDGGYSHLFKHDIGTDIGIGVQDALVYFTGPG